jgi:hypothetical protein
MFSLDRVVRVTLTVDGDVAGQIARAYRASPRDTPGLVVVASGQPADALIQIASITLKSNYGDTGYAWAESTVDPNSLVELWGPVICTTGRSYSDIAEEAAAAVLQLDRDVFASLRKRAQSAN